MCGIIGILGKDEAASDRAIEALRRLEYRGYDSAGIATLDGGTLDRRRAAGKLKNLETLLLESPLGGLTGIGHTRWATHGAPTTTNAHPHISGPVALVHNGIIENFRTLRGELEAKGHTFETETDTETIAHLLASQLKAGMSPVEAVKASLGKLEGAFALGILFEGHDDLLIGARKGSPLVIGVGEDEMFLGSDALAVAPFTNKVVYLEEGDWCVLSRESYTIYNAKTRTQRRSNSSRLQHTKPENSESIRNGLRLLLLRARGMHEPPAAVCAGELQKPSSGCVRCPS